MKFFFPDSQDLVDPGFDFEKERWADNRVRQRDDLYAHEIFKKRAFDGLLVSKGIVDGFGSASGRYTLGQRHRLLRNGVREFFRLDRPGYELPVMGDCGAFTYLKEKEPPYTVDQVIQFYVECRFDLGLSVDHVILEFQTKWDEDESLVPTAVRERQEITLHMAEKFLNRHRKSKPEFIAVGVAQGWSPGSYGQAVKSLQAMGYRYIALGGMVPLKTPEILASLAAVDRFRRSSVKLHLLGVTRTESIPTFARHGVASFDSTSPLRQAFKDDKDNYYTLDRAYTAIRIPQVEGNPTLQKLILSGVVNQGEARSLEKACLEIMLAFEAGKATVKQVLSRLLEYEALARPRNSASARRNGRTSDTNEVAYREVLEAAPWRQCPCEICRDLGHHVILFRGAERNRRRGFHNIFVFYRRLQRELGRRAETAA